MVLNHEQIKSSNIIAEYKENEFGDGSYNLTIAKIVDMNSQINESFILKPQGMVYVVFKEKLTLPADIIGFAHVKTSLTKRGIMATNIGIIDPSYKGYISTLLINFGKSDCFLSLGDPALRVSFAQIKQPTKNMALSQNDSSLDDYMKVTRRNITNLDEKFLNLSNVEKNVAKSLGGKLLGLGIVFTVGAFLMSAYFQFKNSQEKDIDLAIKRYESEVLALNALNKTLQEKISAYEYRIQVMQDSLSVQIDQLKKRIK